MYATARLASPVTTDAVLPLTAIQTSASVDTVVLEQGANAQGIGKAVAVPVVTGRQLGEEVLVTRGVKPGDIVVMAGQNRLPPGATVMINAPVPAAAAPHVARRSPAPLAHNIGRRHELHRHIHPPAPPGAGRQPVNTADGRHRRVPATRAAVPLSGKRHHHGQHHACGCDPGGDAGFRHHKDRAVHRQGQRHRIPQFHYDTGQERDKGAAGAQRQCRSRNARSYRCGWATQHSTSPPRSDWSR